MTALLALIRKDLLLYLGDRRALALNLLMPIVLGAFFGYLFGGSGSSDKGTVSVALVVNDDSAVSRGIAQKLHADDMLTVIDTTEEDATARVRKGKLTAAVILPAGFGEAALAGLFGAGEKPTVGLLYDPSQAMALQMVKGLLTQHVMEVVGAEMTGGSLGKKFVDDSIAKVEALPADTEAQRDLRELLGSVRKWQQRAPAPSTAGPPAADSKAGGLSMPFATRETALSAGPAKYNGYAHSFAGMAVQFILFMAVDVGIGVLLARRQGVWTRLRAAPVSLNTLLAARLLSCALIALALLAAIFGAAALIFGVRITGSAAGFALVCVTFAGMAASFGLLIAAFGRTPEAARGMAIFATLIMVMLGGAWVPSFVFPAWMQTATLVVPTRWAVDGLDAMTWRGLGMDIALQASAVQVAFALLFGALAFWRFGRDAR